MLPSWLCVRPRHRLSRCEYEATGGPGWGWLTALLPAVEQGNLYNSVNIGIPCWDLTNTTSVRFAPSVYVCPSANNPGPTVGITDPNMNIWQGAIFGRADYVHNVGMNDVWSAPATVNYNDATSRANGPMYRNSCVRFAAVTDGLSQTIAAGERTPYLSDSVWPGVVPGSAHYSYGQFTNDDWDGPGSYVASNSGPSIYEPPAIIHPPNSPVRDTDEMYSLHPGGANVLLCDGSVRFIKQSIHLLDVRSAARVADAAERSSRRIIEDQSGGMNWDWQGPKMLESCIRHRAPILSRVPGGLRRAPRRRPHDGRGTPRLRPG